MNADRASAASDRDLLWVGLDLGTQSAKATVVTDAGRVRATGRHPLAGTREGGRHEQDPRAWVDATAGALRDALAALDDAERARVSGIALCSTSGTITVVDETGTPVTTGLMYDDTRGAGYASRLREAAPERWRRLGVTIQPSWALCRIAWLAATGELAPKRAGAGRRVAHQGDIVTAAMTGERTPSNWTSALKSGYDVMAGAWPEEVVGHPLADGDPTAGTASVVVIPPEALPEVVAPGTLIGRCCPDWHERTGLPVGTPVFAGMTDGCAAQLGAGALSPGDWHTVIGTTLVVKGVADHPISADGGALYSHRAPHGDLWLPGGASNVGAGVLTALAPHADLDRLDAVIGAQLDAGRAELTPCYPLTVDGERFPFLDARARGFALRPEEGPLESLVGAPEASEVASLEAGVACVERLCFDVLAGQGVALTGRFSSSGGGARSASWNRMRASLLDRPIALPESAEGGLGMAVLARWGAGQAGIAPALGLPECATAMSRIRTTVDPEPVLAARMSEVYAAFRDALDAHGWVPAAPHDTAQRSKAPHCSGRMAP